MTKTKTDLLLSPEATVSYQPTVDITAAVVAEINALVPSVGIVPPAGWQPGPAGPGRRRRACRRARQSVAAAAVALIGRYERYTGG